MKPVFTEKSLRESKLGRYTFKVDTGMTKNQIAAQIKKIFGVLVTEVRTTKIGPEKGRNARGRKFATPGVKKAIVTLKSGDKIDIFEEGKK